MPNSSEFAELADQWLIAYACSVSGQPTPTLFIIGHCLEAFCKSALLKNNPSLNIYGRNYGHDIEAMIGEIKRDIGMLPAIHFLPTVESKFMTGGLVTLQQTSDPEYQHYIENQELYWTAKFQKELKYIGTSGKGMPAQFAILVMERNPYWIPIIKELRSYVVDPTVGQSFTMQSYLRRTDLPAFVIKYLEAIIY